MRKVFEIDVLKIKNTPYLYDKALEYKKIADENIDKDIPEIPFSALKMFDEEGNRQPFEKYYHPRRALLTAYAISVLVFGDEKYVSALEDCIWAVLNESSWCLSAHYSALDTDKFPVPKHRQVIDLCVAQTAAALVEIHAFVGDKLHNVVRERIEHEIRERVILPFLNKACYYSWEEHQINNWCAVCGAGVGACFFHFATKEEIALALPRLIAVMDRYLESFEDDGICLEGYGYWNYGFYQFVIFADMLYHYTDGDINLMASKKVDNIAHFQQKAFLCENKTISFSDVDSINNMYIGLSHYLYKMFDGIRLPEKKYSAPTHTYTQSAMRDFMWYDDSITDYGLGESAVYKEETAGWFIKRESGFSFVAKGGHNAEPHNHNDLGNFILFKDNTEFVIDTGSGLYSKQYFNPATRYNIFCNRSGGHNVPIIDGMEQCCGEEFAADILKMTDTEFTLELKGAYDIDSLKSFVRSFVLEDKTLKLTDTFAFSDKGAHSVKERFLTYTKPEIQNGCVMVATGKITASSDGEWIVSEYVHQQHDANFRKIYILDFVCEKCDNKLEFVFE